MIRAETMAASRRPTINPLRGEFEAVVGGQLVRFDTRLSTIAAIEAACGDRAIVEVLNGIIVGRRARDLIALLSAALACAEPAPDDPETLAVRANVGEAEAFILALIFALGFKVGAGEQGGETSGVRVPLDGRGSGAAGGSSRSAA